MSFRACLAVAAATLSCLAAGCSASNETAGPKEPLQVVAESFAHSFYAGDAAEAYELQTTRCKVEDDLADFMKEADAAREAGPVRSVHATVTDAVTGTVEMTFDNAARNHSSPWRLEGRDWRYDGCPVESMSLVPTTPTTAVSSPRSPTSGQAYVVECFPDAPGAARFSDGSIHFSAQCVGPAMTTVDGQMPTP